MSFSLTVPYNKGKGISTVGFMFACPGQKEMNDGCVVAGTTGKNLDRLLAILVASENEDIRRLFPSSDRYDYLITNASNIVHYPALDATSLPSNREYQHPDNLARLRDELKGLDYLITFGVQAHIASELLKDPTRSCAPIAAHLIRLPHLSLLSLNQISLDREGKRIAPGASNATELRLKVVASILEKKIADI